MPNDVDVNRWSASFKDYGGEVTTSAFNVLSLADNTAFEAAQTTFENALDDMLLGVQQNRVNQYSQTFTNAPALSPSAQREVKMLARYTDNVNGKGYSVSFGTLDLATAGIVAGTDFITLETTPGSTFKSAFEAFAASPDGNPVTLNSLQFVGRNS